MKKLAVGFAISSALLGAACGGVDGWSDPDQSGTALFDIPSVGGVSLAAEITVYGEDEAVAGRQLSAARGDASIEARLPPGTYTAHLDTFTLFQDGEALPTAEVTFGGFDPTPIVVQFSATTRVGLTFRLGEDGSEISSNAQAPELVVTRVGGCTPECTASQLCANLDGAGAACHQKCVDDSSCAAAGSTCFLTAGICI